LVRGYLIGLVLLAFVVRAGWGLMQPAEIDPGLPDQWEYLQLARNLLAGEGLHFVDLRFADTVYAFRMPGYPLFLAAVGGSVRAARLVQAGVDASTVFAVFLLARRWVDGRTSLLAAAIVAVNPFLVYFSALLLTETLFTAMLAWAMVLLVWRRNYVWGGLVLALSVLVRPSGIALPVVLGIASVFVNKSWGDTYEPERGRLRWPVPVAGTMVLLTVVVLLPWAWRNSQALNGRWVWTTTNEGITRYDGFNPDATGASDQRFVESMPWLGQMDEVERSEYLGEQANEFARAHPRRAAELAAIKVARTWSPVPLSDEYGHRRNQIVAGLYAVPLYLLTLLGLWKGGLPRSAKAFLLVPAVYFTLVHAASVGSLRYRIPVEGPMAVIAAAGAVGVLREGRRKDEDRGPMGEAGEGLMADDADRLA
jgi:4-amino-4-deoxy-L-arabinose transferase-like glycosyltransferase